MLVFTSRTASVIGSEMTWPSRVNPTHVEHGRAADAPHGGVVDVWTGDGVFWLLLSVWNALVHGFTINGDFDDDHDHDHGHGPRRVRRDDFELRITIDGVRLVPRKGHDKDKDHDR